MPMNADEVAELSRLLDEAMALEPSRREPWLHALEQTKPTVAQRLREMLRQAESSDTGVSAEASTHRRRRCSRPRRRAGWPLSARARDRAWRHG